MYDAIYAIYKKKVWFGLLNEGQTKTRGTKTRQ